MSFLAPWNLAWLGLLVPLVGLYVLKRRRQERRVGSTLLWEQALRDLRAERPWKRLMPQLSLLLQALVILAGAIALARPAGAGRLPAGASTVVIVDVSVSMDATEGGRSRLDEARAIATDVARGLPPGGTMMLVGAGSEPAVHAPFEEDAAALERAIAGLRTRGVGADLEAAVALARERLGATPPAGSRILVLTDGALDGTLSLPPGEAPISVERIGGPVANIALVGADARARTDDRDRADIFARVAYFGPESVEVFVTARLVGTSGLATPTEAAPIASRKVSVDGGGSTDVLLSAQIPPDAAGQSPLVRIDVAVADAFVVDALSADDVAVIPSPGARRLPIYLVGRAPLPVMHALQADSDTEIFTTTPALIAARGGDEPHLDGLFVFTGEVPAEPPPGDSIVIAPHGDRVFEAAVGQQSDAPTVVTWNESDPRLRFVSFRDVHMASVRPISGGAVEALMTTDAGTAIGSLRRDTGETTVIGFDPSRSDWPKQTSFVIFFRNLLERARARRAAGGVPSGTVGEPLRIPLADAAEVQVVTPSGVRLKATGRGGMAVVDIDSEPGVFRIVDEHRARFALRNLLEASESNLQSRLHTDSQGLGPTTEITAAARARSEGWPIAAGALLALILLEVAWATRRSAM